MAAAWLPSASADAERDPAGVELVGAWHLTVNYRDEASPSPDAERWDDRVWRFERRGTRLQWTEFPVVVFDDRAGRFEGEADGRPVRVLHFWQPNRAQLAEIGRRLRVSPRGARSKGLLGSAADGYRSAGGLREESASVIGYSETWTVAGLPSEPVFTQDVLMGSGRTQDLEGRTRYASDWVAPDGSELRGDFVRDGTRRGTFVLRRAGGLVVLGGARDGSPGAP